VFLANLIHGTQKAGRPSQQQSQGTRQHERASPDKIDVEPRPSQQTCTELIANAIGDGHTCVELPHDMANIHSC
jgi:hypothetical protein